MRPCCAFGKRVLASMCVVAVSLAAVACAGDDAPSTPGSAVTPSTARDETSPVGTYHGGYSAFMGLSGYLQLKPDGSGRVLSRDGQRPDEDVFRYQVDGDRLVVTSEATWDCDPDEPGSYAWARVGLALELEPVDEPCSARAEAMAPGPGPADPAMSRWSWWSMGDSPIVEVRPGDDPVTVQTPIGTIEWALVDAQLPLSSLTSFDGGFVALASTASGTAASSGATAPQVVLSTDGRRWTPVPPPPVAPEWLGARGGEVWVASGVLSSAPTWPPAVYVTDDNGSSWRAVAVDPAPPGVEPRATGSAAGPAGVLITTQVAKPAGGPLLWVLGPTSFEPVTTPFDGQGVLLSVRALDSGFLAQTQQYSDGPGSFWTSPDGRTWTRQADAPARFRMQGAHGDTVYGAITAIAAPGDVHQVTSVDGGRTWEPAPPRPTGDLRVGDIGLVGVDGHVGWVCSGAAFVSADGAEWAPALFPWPLMGLTTPFISGKTILIPAFDCTGTSEQLHWIGTVVEAPATTATPQP